MVKKSTSVGTSAAGNVQVLQLAAQLHRQGQFLEAEGLYRRFLSVHPDHFDALHWLGILCMQQSRFSEAVKVLARAVRKNPTSAECWINLALSNEANGQSQTALASIDRALAIDRNNVASWTHRGRVLNGLGRFADSLSSCGTALSLNPKFLQAERVRATALMGLGRREDALDAYDKIVVAVPNDPVAFVNRGNVLQELGRYAEALASYDKASVLEPKLIEPLYNRGTVLHRLERYDEEIACYKRVLAINPRHPNALNNYANACGRLSLHAEAIAICDKLLALDPHHANGLNNRGNAFLGLGRFQDALTDFDMALTIEPNFAGAHFNRGNALVGLRRSEEAIVSFRAALALDQNFAEVYLSLGNALAKVSRYDEAVTAFANAERLTPKSYDALVSTVHISKQMCEWVSSKPTQEILFRRCQEPGFDAPPGALLSMLDDPPLQLRAARNWVQRNIHGKSKPLWSAHLPRQKIRLGYLSSDFRQHPVSSLAVELLELHDRRQFDVYGFSAGPDDGSSMRDRLQSACDLWIDVDGYTDADLAARVAAHEIDILIELGGHTAGSRLLALQHRPAPVQVSYLGYPATTGADFIDYIVADPFIVPASEAQYYSEAIVYLPDCFQCNDRKRTIADTVQTRQAYGLPDDGFVFCCFNNNYKLNSEVFEVWMRLLRAVPGSVLWLFAENRWVQSNLTQQALNSGMDASRLVFAPLADYPTYLARMRLADLFLDTRPFNAGTTASDALWSGLPVVTCSGRSFAARMAGSLLHAIGMPELVTFSAGEYENLAAELAHDRTRLATLRDKLEANRSRTALFDCDRFRVNIEAAYQAMWTRHTQGLAPTALRLGETDAS